MRRECEVTTAESMRELGREYGSVARPGELFLVDGPLGAGKTVFAQGFAGGLGVEDAVTSPTFTLVSEYACREPIGTFLHADLYRLETLDEVEDLGIGEALRDGAVAVVEWGMAGHPRLWGPLDDATAVTIAVDATGEVRTVVVDRARERTE